MARPNPFDQAGPISLLIFAWIWSLFQKAKKAGGLNRDDIYPAPDKDKSQKNADKLEE